MKAIGIDPDAAGFVCALVESGQEKPVIRRFSVNQKGLKDFLCWVHEQKPDIIAIEGQSGQSSPLEAALREAGVVFYSLRPVDTDRYRRAVLGENKNNERDAESVALFALSLRDQGKLVMRTRDDPTRCAPGRQGSACGAALVWKRAVWFWDSK